MPASLLEALYLEKAIITTNVNGCREIVKNNFNGYLVKKKDYLSLANRFLDIINNPRLIKIFGKNSKKYFEKKFSKNPYSRMYTIINSL
jgi:glycosyltransferase involved in cell wall biosynthesis